MAVASACAAVESPQPALRVSLRSACGRPAGALWGVGCGAWAGCGGAEGPSRGRTKAEAPRRGAEGRLGPIDPPPRCAPELRFLFERGWDLAGVATDAAARHRSAECLLLARVPVLATADAALPCTMCRRARRAIPRQRAVRRSESDSRSTCEPPHTNTKQALLSLHSPWGHVSLRLRSGPCPPRRPGSGSRPEFGPSRGVPRSCLTRASAVASTPVLVTITRAASPACQYGFEFVKVALFCDKTQQRSPCLGRLWGNCTARPQLGRSRPTFGGDREETRADLGQGLAGGVEVSPNSDARAQRGASSDYLWPTLGPLRPNQAREGVARTSPLAASALGRCRQKRSLAPASDP